MSSVYNILFASSTSDIWMLLDPDVQEPKDLGELAGAAESAGVTAILIGGSFIAHNGFDEAVRAVKSQVAIPVVIFPGGSGQLSPHADGILFMSLLSGRNPQYLIGEQVRAAPIVKRMGLEAIPTGYLLIESGRTTSAQFISNTQPIPRDKPELAVAHAQAAELFGMKAVYLEAGSGAENPVPPAMVRAVVKGVDIPVIAGGGITNVEQAVAAAKAGARVVVVGTAVERSGTSILGEMIKALRSIQIEKPEG